MVITGRGANLAIPEAFLEELKYRCDIESVVSRYVNLRKTGRSLVGLCPFHSEKTPSFHVFPDSQSFYCFGCEAGGDVITFIRKIENLDYIESLKFLAKMAGIDMPEDEAQDRTSVLRSKILEINRQAALFFYHTLISPAGKKGLEYFSRRKLSAETIKNFGLGYAPDSWDSLNKHLRSLGYGEDEIRQSALGEISRRTGGSYDIFRNRVMFPIIDLRGNVIAFGGRVLDDSVPKYLNSRDTPVFSKSRCLFALNFAKNGNSGTLILCEGYMDAIALHQAGFRNAVATLGTALTSEQARLMSRYAKEVIISYDSDAPGRKAADRAIGLLRAAGLGVRVLRIEGGKDPDEFIKTYGAERFKIMLDKCGNHIEYGINSLREKYDINITEQRAAFLKDAAKILAGVGSNVEREVYAARLGEELGVSKESILSDAAHISGGMDKTARREKMRSELAQTRGYKDRLNPEKSRYLLVSRAEESLIALIYKNPDLMKTADALLKPEDLVTALNRKIYSAVRDEIAAGGEADISRLGGSLTPDETGRLTSLLITRQVSNTAEEVKDCCEVILRSKTEEEIKQGADADSIFNKIKEQKTADKRKFEGSGQ
jgi:DNA primase